MHINATQPFYNRIRENSGTDYLPLKNKTYEVTIKHMIQCMSITASTNTVHGVK